MTTGEKLARIEALMRAIADAEGRDAHALSRARFGYGTLGGFIATLEGSRSYEVARSTGAWDADVDALLALVEEVASRKVDTLRKALATPEASS